MSAMRLQNRGDRVATLLHQAVAQVTAAAGEAADLRLAPESSALEPVSAAS
jgi:hypothetical protein